MLMIRSALLLLPLCTSVYADVATFFQYPVPKGEYNCTQGPFLGKYVNEQQITKYHLGEDWNRVGGGDYKKPVFPCAAGKVVGISDPPNVPDAWGKVVDIEHTLPDGRKRYSTYAHLFKILVSKDQQIGEDDLDKPIGWIGDAGGTYSPHLHFEIRTTPWEGKNPYIENVILEAITEHEVPSLFISNRQNSSSWDLPKNRWTSVSPLTASCADLSYIEINGRTYGLGEAADSGVLNSKIRVIGDPETGEWESPFGGMPMISLYDYQLKAQVRGATIFMWEPSFTSVKDLAAIDMIRYNAAFNRFGSVLPDTLRISPEVSEDGWWIFEMKGKASRNRSSKLYQATYKLYPVIRFVTYKNTAGSFGDWVDFTRTGLE